MSWETWVLAFALVCIIEGLIPFTAPEKWLDAVREIGQVASPDVIRKIGLGLLLVGVGVILTNSTARFGGLFSWHFFVELAQENAFETTKKRKTKP